MINTIAYGLTIGGIFYIISIGLSLTFGTMRIVNFAHGFIYTIGAYLLISHSPLSGITFFSEPLLLLWRWSRSAM